jgi:hypothetical protein
MHFYTAGMLNCCCMQIQGFYTDEIATFKYKRPIKVSQLPKDVMKMSLTFAVDHGHLKHGAMLTECGVGSAICLKKDSGVCHRRTGRAAPSGVQGKKHIWHQSVPSICLHKSSPM